MPFTTAQFLSVFAAYNEAIWPLQIAAYGLGVIAVSLAARPARYSGRIVAAVLALFWLWTGAVYHLLFFAAINPLAYVFGLAFLAQGVLLVAVGFSNDGLSFRMRKDWTGAAALGLVLYAMVIYPALGYLTGHGGLAGPIFGVAPCPTTIFTFGLLLLAERPVPYRLLVIPALWSLIGTGAALRLDVPEDYALSVAAIVGVAGVHWKNLRLGKNNASARAARDGRPDTVS